MTRDTNSKISKPSQYFKTPQGVLSDKDLSRDDKLKVLRSMALDAD
jgi:hypothetical protein